MFRMLNTASLSSYLTVSSRSNEIKLNLRPFKQAQTRKLNRTIQQSHGKQSVKCDVGILSEAYALQPRCGVFHQIFMSSWAVESCDVSIFRQAYAFILKATQHNFLFGYGCQLHALPGGLVPVAERRSRAPPPPT